MRHRIVNYAYEKKSIERQHDWTSLVRVAIIKNFVPGKFTKNKVTYFREYDVGYEADSLSRAYK